MITWFAVSIHAAPPFTSAASQNQPDEAEGCSKEQYREKFGALPTYELHTTSVKPTLQDGFVRAQVGVLGRCALLEGHRVATIG